MKAKIFGTQKIIIRPLYKRDIFRVKDFQKFINSLVKEKAQILINKKRNHKEEREWLKTKIKELQRAKTVCLVAEQKVSSVDRRNIACKSGSSLRQKKIVGMVDVCLGDGHKEYVGTLSIGIRKGYRGIGLGTHLIKQILSLAGTCLRPRPKIVRLSAFASNKAALGLYKKIGFKKIAKVPAQYYFQGDFIDELIMILFL